VEPLESADPRGVGGRVSLEGRLGDGGMGRVYYGITRDHEPVAVKVIRPELVAHQEARERFSRETEALRTVQGSHVASLVDASDHDDEQPWLAMEFVRGLTLKQYVKRRGPLSERQAAALGVLLAGALRDIHASGLLHRDLKPGNIMLGQDGPQLIDLGLVAFAAGATDLTTSSATIGTPVCMAPEQISNPRQITAAADVHGLGATLLYALTGHYPYRGDTAMAIIAAVTSPVPPELDGLPSTFTAPVAAMLAKVPAGRPSVDEVATQLTELCQPLQTTIRDLALTTYVEQKSDPPEILRPSSPRPIAPELTPDSVVARLADRLRSTYAATTRL
jgi:serine/threonine protein kinase